MHRLGNYYCRSSTKRLILGIFHYSVIGGVYRMWGGGGKSVGARPFLQNHRMIFRYMGGGGGGGLFATFCLC